MAFDHCWRWDATSDNHIRSERGSICIFFLFLQGKVVLMSKNGSIRWSKVTDIKLLKRSVFVG